MTDYRLSQFFFEMREPALQEAYRADPDATLQRFQLSSEVRRAIADSDVGYLSLRVNAYLLRYFFGYVGMPEAEFLAKIRAGAQADG